MAWSDIDKLEYGKDLRNSAFDNFNKTNLMIEQLNTNIKSLEETVSGFDAKISKIDNITTAVKEIGKNLTSNLSSFILERQIITLDSTTLSSSKVFAFSKNYSFSSDSTPQIYKDLQQASSVSGNWYFIPIGTVANVVETTNDKTTLLSNFDTFKKYRWNISPSDSIMEGPEANTNFIVGNYKISTIGSEKVSVTISGNYRFNVLSLADLADTIATIRLNTTLIPWSIKNIYAYYNIVKNL